MLVAQAASRALGLLIARYKSAGGLAYRVYTELYDSMVWAVVAYWAAVWGTRKFSCVEAVHYRTMSFF